MSQKYKKKQLDLGMALGSSHVHKARTVVNSSFSNKELLSLSGWPKSKIRQRFESSLTCIR